MSYWFLLSDNLNNKAGYSNTSVCMTLPICEDVCKDEVEKKGDKRRQEKKMEKGNDMRKLNSVLYLS